MGVGFRPSCFRCFRKPPSRPAGPLTNAVILSWFSQREGVPRADFSDNRHWPPSLRLLYWVFSGQQSAVWSSLEAAGQLGSAAADAIKELVDRARNEGPARGGGGTGAAISAGVHRAWLSLLPD